VPTRSGAALSEHLHFARTAASRRVSQSASGVDFRESESTLDAHRAGRTGKRVTVMPNGREVCARAPQCPRELEALVAVAPGPRQLPSDHPDISC
jgi:DNA-binding transcriptional LysR family regulator